MISVTARFAAGLAMLAGGVTAAVLLDGEPTRVWAGVLMASYGLVGVGLGGLFFVALHYACGATWAVAIRRIPEALSPAILAGAVGLWLVFVLNPSIYPWMAHPDHLAGFKAWWLDPPFFLVRAAVYVLLWVVFGALILRTSRAQDRSRSPRQTARNVRLSIAFLVVFALSVWLSSVDWIMSLEPHWYSTIFGVYQFAGLFSSALALVILIALGMRRRGVVADFITDSHIHDLGKLLFAFCTFWMYVWFSQYMLIWYANLPEESAYYVRRREAAWLTLFYLNVGLNWVVPFIALLPRWTKRGRVLAAVAVSVLVGRWLDLYLMIWPAVVDGGPRIGVAELGPTVVAAAILVLVFRRAFASAAPVPIGEPALEASLEYHS